MNRPTVLVFVSSVLVAVPFFACENPDANNPPYDAGAFDASFTAPDATPFDSSLPPGDAAQEAAPINTATVVVTDVGAPVAGVTVVFQDAAGTLVGTAVTGADGKASAVVVAGSQITVVTGSTGSRRLLTYLGVKPGDVLNVALPSARAVSIAMATNNPGATPTVEAGNPSCSATAPLTGGPAVLALRLSCITGPVFPVLATSLGGAVAPVHYYSFLKGVAPAASGVTSVMGLSAWAAGTPYDLNVTNAPNLPGASAHLGQIANNQSAAFPATSALVLTAGAGTASFSVAAGYADAYQGEVQFIDYAIPSRQRVVSFAKRVPVGGAAEALDLTPGLLPQLTSLAVTGTTRAIVTWSAASSLAVADSGVVGVTWTQPYDGGSETIVWTFIVPPDALTLTLPELPGPLAAFAPDASSTFAVPAAAFFESDLIPGYDAVRAQAAAFGLATVPMPALTPLVSPALPAAGTLRITALAQGG